MITMLRCLQVNLNHAQQAQDLLLQHMAELQTGIAIVSELYSIPDDDKWIGDITGKVVIIRNPRECLGAIKVLEKEDGYVAIKIGNVVMYSHYISPNVALEDFDAYLNTPEHSIARHVGNIVARDFNAKHTLWGASIRSRRGIVLQDWILQHGLFIINGGNEPTCVREQGRSVVDVTLSSKVLGANIKRWKVLKDMKSLSYRYIYYRYIYNGTLRIPNETRKLMCGGKPIDTLEIWKETTRAFLRQS